MTTEGIDEKDFYLELELYDVVRPPTWQSWNLASSNLATSKASSSASPSTPTPTIRTVPNLDPASSFWKNLSIVSGTYYDVDDTDFFTQILQDALDEKFSGMSLDDLERLAASIPTEKN